VPSFRIWLAIIALIVILGLGSFTAYYFLSNPATGNISKTSSSSSSETTLTQSSFFTTQITTASTSPLLTQAWLTYHDNFARTGVDANEPSVASVSPAFGWKSQTLDGAIYAEPLVDGSMVIAATENNSVYGLDSNTGSIIWHKNLGAPVPGSSLPCGDINPSGITGTPVIDAISNTLYVVAYLKQGGHELFALNLANGGIVFQRNVDPPGVSVSVEQERGALAISQGMVYIPYGGLDGDCGQYHGFVVAVPLNNSSSSLSYQVPTGREGGIWAAAGIAIDPSGNIYVGTGNSEATTKFDYGDAVIKLSPSLKVEDYFAPTNWAALNSGDTDLGSVAPLLLGNETIFQIGKEGVGYLLNASNLGNVGGEEFSGQVCSAYGGLAYSPPNIYVPCGGGVTALRVNLTSHTFTKLWTSKSSFDAGPPIVSGDAVWSIDISGGKLYALNQTTGATIFTYSLGSVMHFSTPSSADGEIFTGADDAIEAVKI
jgi:outer membrane protein assembly factor BamB